MANFHDFNPNGPQAPKIPSNAKRWDFSRIWSVSAHIRLYDFFWRWGRHAHYWPDGNSADWVFLGGAFLGDIQGQSQVLGEATRLTLRARARAQSLCSHLSVGETNTFADRGYALVRADVPSTNVALSLGQFSLYWTMHGRIGPKIRRPDGNFRANYRASISWVLYDYYDFAPYVIVGSIPDFLGVAHPYHITATWSDSRGGIVSCPGPQAPPEDDGNGHDHEQRCYELSGVLVMINACDRSLESIPANVQILTELVDENGTRIEGRKEVRTGWSSSEPDNPSRFDTYILKIKLPESFGEPKYWIAPRVVLPNGENICAQIECPRQRCRDMATRPRSIPVVGEVTPHDVRVDCHCAG